MPPAVFSLARFLDEDEKTEEEISDRTWGCAARSTIPAFYFYEVSTAFWNAMFV